jgi:hypothetical protein
VLVIDAAQVVRGHVRQRRQLLEEARPDVLLRHPVEEVLERPEVFCAARADAHLAAGAPEAAAR